MTQNMTVTPGAPGSSFDAAMGAAMALTRDVELAAAVIAHLHGGAHASIATEVSTLARHAVSRLDELSPTERRTIQGVLTSIFRQASDLIERPDRSPGWDFDDPVILQATGRASMSVAGVLAAVAPTLTGLTQRLTGGGSFCDVGTGTGWLAIAAAGHWPTARVTGIDIFPPALALAERNVAEHGLADRVQLQMLDVRDLDELFDLIWFPGPFLPADVIPAALTAARRSLHSGGWLAFGVYGGPPDPVAQSLADLRTVRSGGHSWTVPEAVDTLCSAGFGAVREVERTWNAPVRLVVGRRP